MNALPLHSAFLNSTSLSHDAAPVTRSIFPRDAHALIYRPARSPMTSAPLRRQEWKLRFERRSPLRIEPLMGWTEEDVRTVSRGRAICRTTEATTSAVGRRLIRQIA